MTRTSFDDLADRHRGELLAYLTRLLADRHDAEDACQDALLRAYRAYSRLRPNSNVRAWLYKIATNTALNVLRRRRRTAARSADVDMDLLAGSDSLERREDLRAVARAVESLPPKQRAALMLRQFQGMNYAGIASTLACSEDSARANVYQAIRKLRKSLAGDREV